MLRLLSSVVVVQCFCVFLPVIFSRAFPASAQQYFELWSGDHVDIVNCQERFLHFVSRLKESYLANINTSSLYISLIGSEVVFNLFIGKTVQQYVVFVAEVVFYSIHFSYFWTFVSQKLRSIKNLTKLSFARFLSVVSFDRFLLIARLSGSLRK